MGHAEPSKAKRSEEVAGDKGKDEIAPSMEEMNKLLVEKVVVKTLEEITLKNGKPAVSLYGDHTHLHMNPSGKFIIGGPQGDAGLTGRKIIIDTYGGAFSGKDPTKVDRSAAYAARYVAKCLVAAKLAKKVEVQLSYAIGVAKPVSILVESYGTGKISDDKLTQIVQEHFDLRPGAIIKSFNLQELPKLRGGRFYRDIAAYGHFGRTDIALGLKSK